MSKIEISNDTRIIRHRTPARFSHWLLVICFFMTMFTGVAFFFPDFAWLTEILGTPQLARAIHPFTGIIMFVAFIFLGYLYWDHNIPEKNDIRWLKGMLEVLKGNEHAVAYNGKYNLGQKNVILDIELGDGYLACNRHHYVASIFLALLLYSGITFCDFTSLFKCIHVVHRYFGTHVHGILGKRLHSWYRGRLGNRSLGEKTSPEMV